MGAKIDSLFSQVEQRVIGLGKEIGGKKGTSITKKSLRSIVTEIAREYKERRGSKQEEESVTLTLTDRPVEECVLELVEMDEEKRKKTGSSEMLNDESSGNEVRSTSVLSTPANPPSAMMSRHLTMAKKRKKKRKRKVTRSHPPLLGIGSLTSSTS